MFHTSICISFTSKLSEIKKVIKKVQDYLISEIPDISEELLFELRLIYSELLINAVAHGNKYDPGKKVELLIKIGDNEILSSVSDEGGGFDYTNWFISRNRSAENVSEHGLGLILVNSLADSIAFNDEGNVIEFHKLVPPPESGMNKSAAI